MNISFITKRKGTKLTTYAFEGRTGVGRSILTICIFNNSTAVITDVFVRAEFRSKGYGTLLVTESLRKAYSFSNINRVLIQDGSEHGETAKIAKKLGFVPGEFQKYWELETKNY